MNLLFRRRYTVRGIVQGVGFRPFVYLLARDLGLAGSVWNTGDGVIAEVEGPAAALEAFGARLEGERPPLALIDAVAWQEETPRGETGFAIAESRAGGHTLIPPDVAVCADCRRELADPGDRRYRYPFLNCTHCGPRYTIIRALPYDRPSTTMGSFPLCAACAEEYADPANRRFHAQPVACPACGPQLAMDGRRGEAALAAARELLAAGGILAVKGIGGFHLACRADDAGAVGRLRERKHRPDQPFAVMAQDLETARRLVAMTPAEERLLASPAAPIVLLPRREADGLAEGVAPGNGFLGVMLPYAPLHALLVDDVLVMTSGNRSGEPIARTNEEARARLGAMADGFLTHDREIEVVCDDSVVRVHAGQPLPVRRARGYAPVPVKWGIEARPLLATGGELKAALCLARGREAFVSQHIGDMENLETLESFERIGRHLGGLLGITPERIVCDAHPGYLSTQWAARQGLPVIPVQHHHAHAAAVIAEYGLDAEEEILAAVYDGTGYGTDGAIWGGEILAANGYGFRRLAHLPYVGLPGGDASVKRPGRMAMAYLQAAGLAMDGLAPETEARLVRQQIARRLNTVDTSSMGRLFDAAAAVLGVRRAITYEAQAAIEMEAWAARVEDAGLYPDPFTELSGFWRALVADPAEPGRRARRVHNTVAAATVTQCAAAREMTGLTTVALTGGVFQNLLLLGLARQGLEAAGFRVLVPRWMPPNDGGLALGQALIGALR